jgi:hypothetical protein
MSMFTLTMVVVMLYMFMSMGSMLMRTFILLHLQSLPPRIML